MKYSGIAKAQCAMGLLVTKLEAIGCVVLRAEWARGETVAVLHATTDAMDGLAMLHASGVIEFELDEEKTGEFTVAG